MNQTRDHATQADWNTGCAGIRTGAGGGVDVGLQRIVGMTKTGTTGMARIEGVCRWARPGRGWAVIDLAGEINACPPAQAEDGIFPTL